MTSRPPRSALRGPGRRDAARRLQNGAKLAILTKVAVNGLGAEGGPNSCGTALPALPVRSRRPFAFQILRGVRPQAEGGSAPLSPVRRIATDTGQWPPLRRARRSPKSSVMSLRPIILHPDPRLKKVCAPVASISPEIGRLAEDMLQTMYDAPGIGLAAPQVGVMSRLIVMDCVKEEGAAPRPMVLVNPRVTWASEALNTYDEGCLSIPEHFGDVTRPAEVEVAWTGLDGRAEAERFSGLWATCVQHEIDHLDGKLFLDYLSPLKRQLITRKMQKLKRELARA